MKITVKEYKNLEEFEQDEQWQYGEKVAIIHYEDGMIGAALLTQCKRWQTAVNRFFRALKNDERFNNCEEDYFINNTIKAGIWKGVGLWRSGENEAGNHEFMGGYSWKVKKFDDGYGVYLTRARGNS